MNLTTLLDTSRNLSIYTIPAAWLAAYAPHVYATRQTRLYDLRSPRTYTNVLDQDQTIDKATKGRIIRSEAAQSNGFENLAYFAAAVLAGNLAKLPAETLNSLSVGYVLSRVVYNVVYINNTTVAMAKLRAVLYFVGIGTITTLFIKSGNALQ